jgi:hypothetical protein
MAKATQRATATPSTEIPLRYLGIIITIHVMAI